MKLLAPPVLFAALLLTTPILADDRPQARTTPFQGTWSVVWTEQGGKREDKTAENTTVTFQGDRLLLKQNPLAIVTADATTSPKIIDLQIIGDDPKAPSGPTLEGIFEMKGDTLTLCVRANQSGEVKSRPTRLTGEEDGVILIYLKRVQP